MFSTISSMISSQPRPRQVVAHVRVHHEARPGIALAVAMPSVGMHQPIEQTVDHQRRRRDLAQVPACGRGWPRRPSSGGPRPRRRSCGANASSVIARSGRRRRSAGPEISRNISTPLAIGVVGVAVHQPAAASAAATRWIRPCWRSPVFDMIDVRLATRLGMADGERLGDHPAHRHADDVGPLDAEVVEQTGGVVGHVGELVGRLGEAAASRARDDLPAASAAASTSSSTARCRGCRSGSP